MQNHALGPAERSEVLDNVARTVTERFYDPGLRGIDWPACVGNRRQAIVAAPSEEGFEREVSDLLSELKSSHIGFYHHALARATSKMAIGATYAAFATELGERWVFQDVHDGGAGHEAGLQSGDVLLSVDGRAFIPPEHPVFPMGQRIQLRVMTRNSQELDRALNIPAPRRKRRELPYASRKVVSYRRLNSDLGLVRISMFPGMVGIEVARDISQAIAAMAPLKRLIIDLRGNTGGGIGVLRVMSLLTPNRLPVGYSLSRKQVGMVLNSDRFPVFDRIPASKLGLLPLAWKFFRTKRPILLMTERLGPQPFQGRVVLLVDRHTASANEMLLAFAREHGLAKIVGEPTPGRLLAGEKFKVGHNYWLALPVGVYHTAGGRVLEGNPIDPDLLVPFDPVVAREGRDPQFDRAVEVAYSS